MLKRIAASAAQIFIWLMMIAVSIAMVWVACWVRQAAPELKDQAYLTAITAVAIAFVWIIGLNTLKRLRFYDSLKAKGSA